jgi:TonB family protein
LETLCGIARWARRLLLTSWCFRGKLRSIDLATGSFFTGVGPMAHSPISRPDPFEPVSPNSVSETSAQSLSQWVSTLTAFGGGSLAADLALDLVLNDIGERARTATGATAAAIALAREGEIVCRATTGENAPDLGARLNMQQGLSAACAQTRKWQHCEDSENDERVDPEVCRRLGVRSILVYPILKEKELLGIIEIFSAHPKAFDSGAIRTLEALAREVIESVDRAATTPASGPAAEPVREERFESLQPAVPAKEKERDFWNDALSLLMIALALILGWVVGRSGWRNTITHLSVPKQVSQPSSVAASNVAVPVAAASAPAAEARDEPAATPAENGLTVYQNGSVVFRTPGQTQEARPGPDIGGAHLRVSPEIANGYVVRRVEPEYPEPAREKKIQGTVEIDVSVGRNGEIQGLVPVRGDAQLVAAASAAIRQWQFQPFFRDGRPEEFQTRVTMEFRLP